jgi:predicted small lipoprotein YifL
MKRLISLMLAALMVLSLAACGSNKPAETTTPTTTPVETTEPVTVPTYEAVENPVTFFSLSLGENYENIRAITVFMNEDGTAYVEFVSDVKKVGNMDANIFNGITEALNASGLAELNGQDVWGEGEANGSMYIELADGTMLAAGFNGEIPEAYTTGYATMEAFFTELTAGLEVYVPQPLIQGEVNEQLLGEMNAILTGAGIPNLDGYIISEVAKDEYFSYTIGNEVVEGIVDAATCAPMMMTSAYSLAIVTVEDGADVDGICAGFENGLDWMKWICVAPTDAMIAVKDNMILCLMAADDAYTMTVAGIEAAGWTVVNTYSNPNA